MKNWEDIIKDKLEGYESPLPEGSLAEFHSRREANRAASPARSEETASGSSRDSAGSAAAKKRSPLVWILPTAAAAGLAAFLFLRQPGTPGGDGQDSWQPSTTIAVANTDTTDAAEPVQPVRTAQPAQPVQPVQQVQSSQPAQQLIAQAATPKAAQPATSDTQGTASTGQTEKADPAGQQQEAVQAEPTGQTETTGPAEPANQPQVTNQPGPADNQDVRTATTFDFPTVELQKIGRDASYNYAALATAGSALGAGLLATLATNINFGLLASNTEPEGASEMRYAHAEFLKFLNYLDLHGIEYTPEFEDALIALMHNSAASSSSASADIIGFFEDRGIDTSDPSFAEYIDYLASNMFHGGSTNNPKKDQTDEPQVDNRQKITHHMPIKAALSVRTPVAEKLYLTTGLEYSRYVSTYTYSLSGNHKQVANYLGIPLRMDWTFVSNRWLDLYVGGGVEAEWCLGATMDGQSIGKDKFSMSLLGAGGLQLNVTKNIGIYVEPEVSWKMTLEDPVLATYRTEHPLMFAVATGIRLTID
ncbi:MAG: hypothetical protein IKX11_04430 [Bacteroidales bacterium]|nr:hypothetical protein [Bacteroidales bacterium]